MGRSFRTSSSSALVTGVERYMVMMLVMLVLCSDLCTLVFLWMLNTFDLVMCNELCSSIMFKPY